MKRMIAYILVLAMLFTFAGCSDAGSTGQGSGNVGETVSNETDSSEGEVSESYPINTATAVFAKESEERIKVETDAQEAVNLYLVARMYLDKFLQYDIESGNPEEYAKLLDDTIKAFENVEAVSAVLEENASNLERTEARAECDFYEEEFFRLSNPFVVTVYAEEESEAVKWAKDITERFDKAPAGKGIRTLASQMGTDAKHAYAQLRQAQDILSGAAYNDFAKTADTAYKTAKVLKTAGTAAQFSLSIMTADPATMTEAVMAAGGILVNGFNTVLEVGQTGSILMVGDDNKVSETLENIENAIAPIGSALGLYSLSTNIAKGAELLKDTPAMADSIMYIGTSLNDYLTDGKIMGGAFKQAADGTISCTILDTMTIKSAWAKDDKAAEEVLESVGYTKEEIQAVQNNSGTEPVPFDPLAEIPPEKIEIILEDLTPILPEEYVLPQEAEDKLEEIREEEANEDNDSLGDMNEEISEEDDSSKADEEFIEEESVDEDDADDAKEADDEEDADDEEAEEEESTDVSKEADEDSSGLSVEDIVGYYPFYVYMTLGDQSAEGEYAQTISRSVGNKLKITADNGFSLTGMYDPSTHTASFTDTDGSVLKVTFTDDNGRIHASIKQIAEGGTLRGSAYKQ